MNKVYATIFFFVANIAADNQNHTASHTQTDLPIRLNQSNNQSKDVKPINHNANNTLVGKKSIKSSTTLTEENIQLQKENARLKEKLETITDIKTTIENYVSQLKSSAELEYKNQELEKINQNIKTELKYATHEYNLAIRKATRNKYWYGLAGSILSTGLTAFIMLLGYPDTQQSIEKK